jgi:hypothetical protein
MNTRKLGFAAFVLGFVGACAEATGPGFENVPGSGGSGGEGGIGGSSGGNGGAAMTSSSSSGGGSSSSSSSGGGSSSSSSASSSSGGPTCGASEHLCSGICTGNTPATGCFTSQTCAKCGDVPNGAPICNAQGACDANCPAGYTKNGYACECQSACCVDKDCGSGNICTGGTCSTGGGGMCDDFFCALTCVVNGGFGACAGGKCLCFIFP